MVGNGRRAVGAAGGVRGSRAGGGVEVAAALGAMPDAAGDGLVGPEPGDVLVLEADGAATKIAEAGDGVEQRRLAGAVRSAQANALALVDLPGDVLKEDAFAEGLGKGGELDQKKVISDW